MKAYIFRQFQCFIIGRSP